MDRLEGDDGRMRANLEVWPRREFGPSEAAVGAGRGGQRRVLEGDICSEEDRVIGLYWGRLKDCLVSYEV